MQIIKRSLLWLMTAAVPVVIAACYGPYYNYTKSGRVLDKQTRAGVANIAVSCADPAADPPAADAGAVEDAGGYQPSVFVTGPDGAFYWGGYQACNKLKFEDVDGQENGGLYLTAIEPLGDPEQELEVELEKAPQ
ncbi:MAG: hypothetical protein JXR83_10135 [Deltaproteobacteria bacterium]|nr:hypothetical protein [Deltaproteobacteria bacterium]